jgi:hypothetical protein
MLQRIKRLMKDVKVNKYKVKILDKKLKIDKSVIE